MPELNVALLDEVRKFIGENKEKWDQELWGYVLEQTVPDYQEAIQAFIDARESGQDSKALLDRMHAIELEPAPACGTRACFAGWTVLLRGATMTKGGDFVDDNYEEVWAGPAAQELLGLTNAEADALFQGTNDLEDIDEVIAKIKAGYYRA